MKLTEEVFKQIVHDIESLRIDAEKIIITGSVALCVFGLKDEFNDIDLIIINPSKSSHQKILVYYSSNTKDGYSRIRVNDKTFDMDLFIDNCPPEHPIVEVSDGIYLSTLDCIINAKKWLNREKDFSDFSKMVDKLNDLCDLPKINKPTKMKPNTSFILMIVALYILGCLLTVLLAYLDKYNII